MNTTVTTVYDFSAAQITETLMEFARTAREKRVSPAIMMMITAVKIGERRFTIRDLSDLFISEMEGNASSHDQRRLWISLAAVGSHLPQLGDVRERAQMYLRQPQPNTF